MRMLTIEGLISVLGLCLTCFGFGYAIGSSYWASVDTDVLLYVQYTTISKVPQAFFSGYPICSPFSFLLICRH